VCLLFVSPSVSMTIVSVVLLPLLQLLVLIGRHDPPRVDQKLAVVPCPPRLVSPRIQRDNMGDRGVRVSCVDGAQLLG